MGIAEIKGEELKNRQKVIAEIEAAVEKWSVSAVVAPGVAAAVKVKKD